MLLLSLILPVYNMESYLAKCLDSILGQGLAEDEYEVILVNDGSTDGSQNICEQYCGEHANFRLMNQPNQGVAVARNTGIDAAQGKFVGFVDPDDYLLDGGLSIAFRKYAERDDIELLHFYSSYDFWDVKPIEDAVEYEGTTHDFLLTDARGLPSFCWIYIYRKDFLDKHAIRFKKYRVGEDQLFVSTVFLANPRYLSVKADIYRYVVHESSASTNRRVAHARQCVDDYLNAYHDLMMGMEQYGITENRALADACIRSVDSKKTFGYTRILTASYSLDEFCRIKQWCSDIGFTPYRAHSCHWKARLVSAVENVTTNNFVLYKLMSWLFNHVVTPYVMPRLRVSFTR